MARAVETASYWQPALPDTTLVDRAILVASELVTNAAVHARTDLRLRLVDQLGRAWGSTPLRWRQGRLVHPQAISP